MPAIKVHDLDPADILALLLTLEGADGDGDPRPCWATSIPRPQHLTSGDDLAALLPIEADNPDAAPLLRGAVAIEQMPAVGREARIEGIPALGDLPLPGMMSRP